MNYWQILAVLVSNLLFLLVVTGIYGYLWLTGK